MFDYAKFAEGWAELYKPMHHVTGIDSLNKRFFICDSYMAMTEFMHNMEPDASPVLIIESQQEGNVTEGWDYPRYTFYFMVRADYMNDGRSAIDAKSEAKTHLFEFVNFMRTFKEYDERADELRALPLRQDSYLYDLRTNIMEMFDRSMENIEIEDFAYESLNQLYDGWYGATLTLSDKQVFNKCVDLSLYS